MFLASVNIVTRVRGAFLTLLLVCVPTLASAAPVTPETISLWWATSSTYKGPDLATKWEKLCQLLGQRLIVAGGALGDGVFTKVECVPIGSRPPQTPWRLMVRAADDGVNLKLYRLLHPKDNTPEGGKQSVKYLETSALTLPSGGKTIKGLVGKGVPALLAQRLLDGMPMGWWFDASSLSADGSSISRRALVPPGNTALSPPEELVFFRTDLDERRQLWLPEVLGRATTRREGSRLVWNISPQVAEAIRHGGVWAHNLAGRGQRSQDLEIALRRSYETVFGIGTSTGRRLNRSVWNLGRRVNRLGARYGASILPGEELIQSQRLYGLFADMRHGPYAGWRAFVDRIPKVTTSEGMSLQSDRYLLGFAVTLAPGLLLQQIDVTPRLGFWDLQSRLIARPGIDGDPPLILPFNVTRAGSGGLEAGVEFGDGDNAFRVWVSYDRGINLLAPTGPSAEARRLGVDLFLPFIPVGKLGETQLQLLFQVFGFFEQIDLTRSISDQSASEITSKGLSFQDAFLGAGIGVTW
jgi:hypothetical protein